MSAHNNVRFASVCLGSAGTIALGLLLSAGAAAAEEQWAAVVSPENSLAFDLVKGETPVLHLSLGGWGPNWAWVGIDTKEKAKGERLAVAAPFVVNRSSGEVIDVKFQAWKSSPRQVSFRYDLSAAKDVPITMLIAGLGVEKPLARGKIVLSHADGQQSTWTLPLRIGAAKVPASKAVARFGECRGGGDRDRSAVSRLVRRRHARHAGVGGVQAGVAEHHAHARLPVRGRISGQAGGRGPAGQNACRAGLVRLPAVEQAGPKRDRHGRLARAAGGQARRGAHGRRPLPVRGRHAGEVLGREPLLRRQLRPAKKDAEFTAARYAKYGVNGVRLHKFSYPKDKMGIGDLNDATRMDPEGLDRLDYFAAQMKKRGVYFGWSHTFGFHVSPGNRSRLAAYDEIAKNLKGNTYAFINFAEDVQDLMIEMVVKLLKHKNPYTGLSYAQEPALSFIEMQNEDDIFFYTSTNAFKACPTYQKLFVERFSDWLKAKYGSEDKLKAAWQGALDAKESLAARNIVPQTNPWFFSDAHLPGQQGGQRQRLLDTARFLHDAQNKFYAKFLKAIREAGYQGPVCGSPWQAPAMVPHYYNLRSDYLAGYIDRHNYFGEKLFDSMLARPGSGYFSSGLQQVIDRPFGLSEWIHVYPSLYSAEGPAIIAAYGMGLQGWDASYEFQSQAAARMFNDRVGWFQWGVWETDVPTQIGQYPALARMIYRGDVQEGEVISVRRVSLEELAAASFSFADKVIQQGDVKSFGGSVPQEALAAGRVVVQFTEKPEPSTTLDMDKYREGSAIASATKQLFWDTAGRGCFAVNTPGTKAVVGFADGKKLRLGSVTLDVACPYASIFVTSLDKDATLANAKSGLVTAVAQLQQRIEVLCGGRQGAGKRQGPDPLGAGQGNDRDFRPHGFRGQRAGSRRPANRQNAAGGERTIHDRRHAGPDAVLRGDLPVAVNEESRD